MGLAQVYEEMIRPIFGLFFAWISPQFASRASAL